ncbi:hypothetical protein N8720_04395 [Candidatus Marinimicrobia bacterium]|nr:hypothetical protein [Candidatus Neomarinimicrobiota bacterium]
MEDLLLGSFAFFFLAGLFGLSIYITSPGLQPPKQVNKIAYRGTKGFPENYLKAVKAWEKTKEGKKYTRQIALEWKVAEYWFYIMLAHGAIFFIMLLSS